MKTIKRLCAAIMVIACILGMNACGAKKTAEDFFKSKSAIKSAADTTDLVEAFRAKLKPHVLGGKDSVEDSFLTAAFHDGLPIIQFHVLTEDGEYVVYDVDTGLNGVMVAALTGLHLNPEDWQKINNFLEGDFDIATTQTSITFHPCNS